MSTDKESRLTLGVAHLDNFGFVAQSSEVALTRDHAAHQYIKNPSKVLVFNYALSKTRGGHFLASTEDLGLGRCH